MNTIYGTHHIRHFYKEDLKQSTITNIDPNTHVTSIRNYKYFVTMVHVLVLA